MAPDSVIQSVKEFFDLLETKKISYVLVGGIALLYYVEGRNTQDVAVILAASSLKKLNELQISSQEKFFAKASLGELQIDFLLTGNRLFKQVHQKFSKTANFLDRNIPIATVEGLLLLKLYALPSLYRQGNFARIGLYENDIAILLHEYHPDMDALLVELSNHVSQSHLKELQAVVKELGDRFNRFTEK